MLAGGDFGNYQLVANFGAGIGFAGLLAALVARQRVLVAIFVAFMFGGLRTGSGFLRATGVSGRIADVVQGLLVLSLLLPPAILYVRERRRALAATSAQDVTPSMSDFLSAVGDIATNESAYRNAAIAAVVLLFAALGRARRREGGHDQHLARGDDARRRVRRRRRAGPHRLGLGGPAVRRWSPASLVALVQANMSHRLPADQFVVGLVLNVLVLGLVGFLASSSSRRPTSSTASRSRCLADIPLVGPALFDQPWVLYLAYPIIPVDLVADLPHPLGARGARRRRRPERLRRLGSARQQAAPPDDLPRRADRRPGGWILPVRPCRRFEDSLIGGRGYIAIAAVIFGGWTLKGTVAGCILFGIVGSFVLTIPSLGYDAIDPAFLAIAPNVVTIVAMATVRHACSPAGGARPPVHPRAQVKAVSYHAPGGVEVLEYADLPDPEPGAARRRRRRRSLRPQPARRRAAPRLVPAARFHLPAHRRHGRRRHGRVDRQRRHRRRRRPAGRGRPVAGRRRRWLEARRPRRLLRRARRDRRHGRRGLRRAVPGAGQSRVPGARRHADRARRHLPDLLPDRRPRPVRGRQARQPARPC